MLMSLLYFKIVPGSGDSVLVCRASLARRFHCLRLIPLLWFLKTVVEVLFLSLRKIPISWKCRWVQMSRLLHQSRSIHRSLRWDLNPPPHVRLPG